MDYDSRNSFEFFLSVDSSKLVPSKERTGQFPKRRIVQFSRLYKTTEASWIPGGGLHGWAPWLEPKDGPWVV